jgi:hypothetical protein
MRCDESCERRNCRRHACILDYLSALERVSFTQLVSSRSVMEAQRSGVAYAAHVVGAVFRALTVRFFEEPGARRAALGFTPNVAVNPEPGLCTTLVLCNLA